MGATAVCVDPGTILRLAVDQAWRSRALKSRKIFRRPVFCGAKLPRAGPAVASHWGFPALAEHLLLSECGGRDVPQPGWPECHDQTCPGAGSGIRDGNLVSFDQCWRMACGKGWVSLCIHAAAEAVRHQRSGTLCRGLALGAAGQADQKVDVRRDLGRLQLNRPAGSYLLVLRLL